MSPGSDLSAVVGAGSRPPAKRKPPGWGGSGETGSDDAQIIFPAPEPAAIPLLLKSVPISITSVFDP
jgi:hypothetical protein